MKKILVVGLGSMGYGIAESLIRSGYTVYGQDKNLVQQKNLWKKVELKIMFLLMI